MVGLAENGGGNYYFIENPNAMALILNKEFNMISGLVAQNASIELTLGENVVIHDVVGCGYQPQSNHYSIPIGDLYSNERRDFTVEVGVPPGTGSLTVAKGILRYESENHRVDDCPAFACTLRYTKDLALIDKERDIDVQAKADIAVSTRTVDKAMHALDDGKTEEAAEFLRAAKGTVNSSPAMSAAGAGSAALREQAARLGSFEDMLKDSTGDARKAKKTIQYENYRTQKGKQ
jgi:Ca-activated chloride channel family protein